MSFLNTEENLTELECNMNVLLSGHIPHDWLLGIIKPIYKNKGDINDPDNYRGIILLSCLGKLYISITNERLTAFINSDRCI